MTISRPSLRHRLVLQPSLLALAVASCFPGTGALANPLDPTVVNGSAIFQQHGATLSITNSPNAIIDWRSFSIGEGEVTRFIQQSSASQVLNRVIGGDPSQILGTLQSNGRVFLINPNGIVFGRDAVVDVAGLVASTLNISNADFLSGKLLFGGNAGAGIRNEGLLHATGDIYLIAPTIENNGVITAPDGSVMLAAGKSVSLVDTYRPDVMVDITAPANEVINVGQLVGGHIGIYAGAIRHEGTAYATTAVIGGDGAIIFKAQRSATLAAGSSTSATGANGGTVAIDGGSAVTVAGTVEARGVSGVGGRIHVTANQVTVGATGAVDASGRTGGGTVAIGGGLRGTDASIANAGSTTLDPGSILRADAIDSGNGGTITVWSETVTQAMGAISARGGAQGGDGGLVETSSRGLIALGGTPDVSASFGAGGTWLIDPFNITVVAGDVLTNNSGAPAFNPSGTSTIGANLIATALSNNINVVLDTTGAGADAGNITISSQISAAPGAVTTLTLNAHNNIDITAAIRSTGSALNVALRADQDGAGGGQTTITAGLDLAGGTLSFLGGAAGRFNNGAGVSNATITTPGGALLSLPTFATNPTFSNVTLNADLLVSNGARLSISNGLTIDVGRTITLNSTDGSFTSLEFTGTQALSGAGTVRFTGNGNNANLRQITNAAVLTIGPGVTVAAGGIGSVAAAGTNASIVNEGTLVADTAGKTLTIGSNTTGTTFENRGTMRVDGGIVSLIGAWNNDGASAAAGAIDITANGGTLNLDGTFSAAQFGNFSRAASGTAGTVNISGVMSVPTLFELDSTKGIFFLNGGGLIEGAGVATSTLRTSGTGGLINNGLGNASAITFDTDVTINNGNRLTVTGGFALAAGRTITVNSTDGSFTSLDFSGTQTFSGNGTVRFTGNGNNANLRQIFGGSVLTIGSGITVSNAGNGRIDPVGTGSSIINQGTILANSPGRIMTVSGIFENQGTLRVDGGSLSLTGTWNNDGASASPGTIDITANGGTLTLGGTFNSDQFGTFTRANAATAGTVNINGTMTVPTLFTLDSTKGIFNLRGGTIAGTDVATSTVRSSGTGGLAVTTISSASAITFDTDVDIANAARLNVSDGLGISTGRTITVNSTDGSFTSLEFNGTQTLSGNGTVRLAGAGNNANLRQITSNAVLTVGPGVTVAASGNHSVSAASNGSSIVNQGTLVADTAGRTLSITGAFENQGTVRVDGGTVSLTGAWNNDGASAAAGTIDITANGGTLNLGGTFNTDQFGTFTRANAGTAGTVNITGTMTVPTLFTIDSTKGLFNLRGGTVAGTDVATSTLRSSGTGGLAVPGISSASGITLDADVTIGNASRLNVTNGLGIATGRTITVNSTDGSFTSLEFNGTQTLSGNGTVSLTGAGNAANLRQITTNSVLTVGPGVTVANSGNHSVSAASTGSSIVNQGTIVSDTAGRTLSITGAFENQGTVRVDGGTVSLTGAWNNDGASAAAGTIDITANGGTLNLGGTFNTDQFGTFTRANAGTAGTVNITGTMTVPTLFTIDSTKGLFNLRGGTVAGTDVATSTLRSSGTGGLAVPGISSASGITLDADVTIGNASRLNVTNGLGIATGRTITVNSTDGSFTSLEFSGTQTLSGNGTVRLTGAGNAANLRQIANGGVLTVGPGVTVASDGNHALSAPSTGSSIVNQGTIVSDTAGRTLTIAGAFENQGTVRVDGGNVSLTGAWTNDGASAPPGTIDITAKGGTLNLGGTFNATQFGIFNRANSGTAGTVNLTGTMNNAGNTFVFDSTKGVVNLVNGAINGGTLQQSGTGLLAINANSNSSLTNGVTLDMDLSVNDTQIFTTGGLTVQTGRTLTVNSANGNFTSVNLSGGGTETLGGGGTVLLTGVGNNSSLRPLSGTAAIIGPDITVRASGTSGMSGDANNTIENRGTIIADTAGRTLTISAPFTNAATGELNIAGGNVSVSNLQGNTGQITVSSGTFTVGGTNWTSVGGNIALNGGTMNLAGTFAGTQFANITRGGGGSAGTLNLTGTMNNAGNTFVFDSPKGVVNLVNGTINGGTLQQSGTGLLAVNTAGNLTNGVTLDMDLSVNNVQMTTTGGLTVQTGRTLTVNSANGNFTSVNLSGGGTETLGGGGTVVLTGVGNNSSLRPTGGTTAIIGPDMTVRASGTSGMSGDANNTIENRGTIVADTAGRTLTISAPFTNAATGELNIAGGNIATTNLLGNTGQITVSSGTYNLSGTNWDLSGGGLALDGGVLNLGGTFAGTQFANITRGGGGSAGTLNLAGIMNNAGSIFTFDSAKGVVNLTSGTISGGTLQQSGTGALAINSGSSGSLTNGITLDMDLSVNDVQLTTTGGLTVQTGRTLTVNSANGNFTSVNLSGGGTETLGGGGTVLLTGNGNNASLRPLSGTAAIIGPDITVRASGTSGMSGDVNNTIENRGTIIADTAGRTLTISAPFTNAATGELNIAGGNVAVSNLQGNTGQITVSSGTFTVGGTNWNSVGGNIALSGGTMNLDGTFAGTQFANITRGGGGTAGTLNLTGTMNNAGSTFVFDSAKGVVNLINGAISGGTLQQAGTGLLAIGTGSSFTNGVTLDMDLSVTNVQFTTTGGLIIPSGRTLTINSVNGNFTSVNFSGGGTETLAGGGTVLLTGTANNANLRSLNATTATIAPDMTVRFDRGGGLANGDGSSSIVNQGTITLNGASTSVNIGNLANQGTIELVGGATFNRAGNPFTNSQGATIGGVGTIAASTFTNNGTLRAGNSPGLLKITGNLVLGATSVTEIEVAGASRGTLYDAIDVTGSATLGGTANVVHLPGYTPNDGDTFLVISAAGGVSGTFAQFTAPVAYNQQLDTNSVVFQVGGQVTPVLFWNTNNSGQWTLASNWNKNRVPTAADIVIIDRGAANPVVTINVAGQQALQLRSDEELDINGPGNLTLVGPSSITGPLVLSNGLLTANAALTLGAVTANSGTIDVAANTIVTGSAAFSNATLTGAGAVTFNGNTTFSGGTLSGTGTLTTNGISTLSGTVTDNAKPWTNNGAMSLVVNGRLLIQNNAVFTNTAAATIDLGNSSSIALGDSFGASQSRLDNAGTINIASTNATPIAYSNSGGLGVVNNTGTIHKTSATGQSFNSQVIFNNPGTLDVQAGALSLDNGTGAAGTVDIASGATVIVNGGTSSFADVNGAGTLRLANGTLNFDTAFTFDANTPAFQITGGILGGAGDLTVTQALTLPTFTLAGTGRFTTNGATTITGLVTDTVKPWTNNGTLTINGAGGLAIVQNAVLTNTANATIDLNGTSTIALGNSFGANQSRLDNAGTINIASTNATPFTHNNSGGLGVVNNTGTIHKTSGTTQNFSNNVIFNNTGTLDVQAGALSLDNGTGAAAGTVDIASNATVIVNGGTSSFSDVNGAGILRLANGTLNFDTAFTFDANTPAFQITGGILGGAGDLTVTQALTLPTFTLAGTGRFITNGATTVTGLVTENVKPWTNNGTLTVNGAGGVAIVQNAVLTNTTNATINVNGTGVVVLGNSFGANQSRLDNAGTINIASTNATPFTHNNSGGLGVVNNTGTIHKTSGTTQNFSNNVIFNNTGTLDVQAGALSLDNGTGAAAGTVDIASNATVIVNGGTSSFSDVNGAGILRLANGTLNFDTAFTFDANTPAFQITGGILGGTGDLTVSQALTLPTFTLAGTGRFITNGATTVTGLVTDNAKPWTNNGTLTVNGAGGVAIVQNAVLTNTTNATINLNGTGSVVLGNSFSAGQSRLDNAGTINIASTNATPFAYNNSGNLGVVNNTGTINKTSATTQNFSSNVIFNNSGTLDVQAGALSLDNGTGTAAGTVDIASGATVIVNGGTSSFADVNGAGTLRLASGTLNFDTAFTFDANTPALQITGGILGGTGDLTVSQALTLPTFTLAGTGRFITNGATTVTGLVTDSGKPWTHNGTLTVNGAGGVAIVQNAVLTNTASATINLNGTGSVVLGNSFSAGQSRLDNAGTINIASTNATPFAYNNSGNLGVVNNTGTINKTSSATQNFSSNVIFNNSGTVNVQAGRLNLDNSATFSGTVDVATNATVGLPAATTSGGRLQGTGTIVLGAGNGTLTNNGMIAPAGTGATGTLTISGNLTQGANGTTEIEIAGNSPGQSDALQVTGTANLNGTLNVVALGGYTGNPGDNFSALVTYASRTGTYSAITLPPGVNGIPNVGPTGVSLTFDSGVVCTADVCWVGTTGDWNTLANWSTGALPTAGQSVLIDVPGLQTVTISSGAQVAGSITVNDVLTLSGGSFTTGGQATFNNGLNIAGGVFNADGDVSITGLNLSTGIFNLASGRTATLSGAAAWSGGTLAGIGATVNVAPSSLLALNGDLDHVLVGLNLGNAGAIQINGSSRLVVNSNAVVTNTASGSVDLNDTSAIVIGLSLGGPGSQFNNAGVLTIDSTAATVVSYNGGNRGFLNNSGTINKTNAATQNFSTSVDFNNTGTLNVDAGSLSLDSGSGTGPGNVDIAGGATLIINGGASSNFAATLASGSTLAVTGGTAEVSAVNGAGTVRVANTGVLNLNSAVSFDGSTRTLQVAGGTLGGTGAVTVDHALAIGSATFAGAGVLTTNGTTTVSGTLTDNSKPWNNNGALALNGAAQLIVNLNGAVTNTASGSVDLNDTSAIVIGLSLGGPGSQFNNAGVLTIDSTAATVVGYNGGNRGAFNNSGTVTKTSAATQNFSTSVDFNNTGTLNVDAGSLSLDSGSGTGPGNVDIAGGATLIINGGASSNFAATLASGSTLAVTGGTAEVSAVNGAGTVRVANTGVLNLNSAVSFDGSTRTLQVAGGTLGGTGAVTVDHALAIGSATFAGAGVLTTNGTTTVSGTLTDNSKPWNNNGALALNGAAQLIVNLNGAVTNTASGSVDLNDTSAIVIGLSLGGPGSQFNNAGVLTIDSTAATVVGYNGGNRGAFNNSGTVTKTSAATQNFSTSVDFNNTGTLNVDAGSLSLDSGSGTGPGNVDIAGGATLIINGGASSNFAATLASGSTLAVTGGTAEVSAVNGAGTVRVANTGVLNLNSAISFDGSTRTLQVAGGTLGGTGAVTVDHALAIGSATFAGAGVLTTNGTTTVSGTLTDNSKPWNNNGALALNGAAQLIVNLNGAVTNTASGSVDLNDTSAIVIGLSLGGPGSQFNNAGVLTIDSTAATVVGYNGGNRGAFNNSGTVTKTSAATQNFTSNANFNNTGILNIDAGRLNLDSNTSLAGTIDVASNATLGLLTNTISNGRLQGTGTIVLGDGTGTLTNNGIIAPAGTGATGTLGITGNLTQTGSGTTELEVAGTSAGQFDVLQVSGVANLNGTLDLATTGGYTGTPGDNFAALLTYSAHTGNPVINVPPGVNGTPALGATGLSFSIAAIDCGGADVCWVGTTGDWSTLANWSTGALPTAGQSVLINVPGTQTITISAGAQVAGSITVDDVLTISGGSFTVGGQATFTNGLNLSGGIFNANGNASINGLNLSAGAINIASGRTATLSGAAAWSGGTVGGPGSVVNIASTASLALNGNVEHMLAGVALINNGALAVNGNSVLTLTNNAVLTNTASATIDLNDTSSMFLGGSLGGAGTRLDNAGTVNIASTAATPFVHGFSAQATFTNTGTINKTSTAVQNFSNLLAFNNTGTLNVDAGTLSLGNGSGAAPGVVDIASGATLILDGGTSSFSAINGAGVLRMAAGTFQVNSPLTVAAVAPLLQLNGGTLAGTGALTVNGAIALGNVTLTGTGALTTNGVTTVNGDVSVVGKPWANNGALAVNGNSVLTLTNNAVLTNTASATIDLNDTSSMFLGGSLGGAGTRLDNAGTIDIASTAATPFAHGFSAQATFTNTGTINKTSTAVQNFSNLLAFNNTGTLNVDAGTLSLGNGSGAAPGVVDIASGATLILDGGTSSFSAINGAGVLRMAAGTFQVNSPLTVAAVAPLLQLNGGTLAGTGALTVNGAIALGNVTLTGTGALTTNGVTTVNGEPTDIIGKPWINNGAIVSEGRGVLRLANNAVLTNTASATIDLNDVTSIVLGDSQGGAGTRLDNAGTINIASTADTPFAHTFTSQATFTNTGTINKTSTAVQNFSNLLAFNNTGTLNVQAGRLNLDGSAALSGTVDVATNATLGLPAATTSSGRLQGTGTIVLGTGTGTLTNNGVIAPAGTGATGTLRIDGNLTQGGTGTTEIEIAGTAAGQFDLLQVSGDANLSGTLNLVALGGYTGNPGDDFAALVTYNSRTGTYTTITVPPGVNGTPTVGANGVSFLIASAIDCGGVDVCWVGTTGDWSTLSNWSTGALPTAGQSVLIDVPNALETITISAGTQVAGSITVNENLTLSGGSFTLTGQGSFNQALNLDGGQFRGNGNISINQFNLNAGSFTLTGGRTATLTGASIWSDQGTIAVSNTDLSGAAASNPAILAIASGGSLALNGNGDHAFTSLTLENRGLLTLNGGSLLTVGVLGRLVNAPGATIDVLDTSAIRLAGGLRIPVGNPLGGNFTIFGAPTASNAGTINIASTAATPIGFSGGEPGSVFGNSGTINKTSAASQNFNGNIAFGNTGTLKVQAGTLSLDNGTGTTPGMFEIANGATLILNGGASSVSAIDGAGVLRLVNGTLDLNSNLAFSTLTPALELIGGTLGGTGALTFNRALTIGGTTLAGTGLLTTNAATTITGNATLSGRSWTNNGAVTIDGAGRLAIRDNAVMTNTASATIDLDDTGSMTIGNSAGAGQSRLENAGTLTLAQAGNAVQIDSTAALNNSGTLRLLGGGDVFSTSQGGALVNTGTIRNDSTATAAAISGVAFRNTGGTLATTATADLVIVSDATYEGTTAIIGDRVGLAGANTFSDGAVLDGTVNLAGRPSTFGDTTVNGVLSNIGGGAMNLSAGKTLTIAGPGRGLFSATSFLGSGTIRNRGQLDLSGVSIAGSLVNEGSLDIGGAATTVDGDVLTLSTGILNLGAGATLTKGGGAASWNGGTITGTGSLVVAAGGTFSLGGAGARVLDGPTLTLPTLNVANGSLTLQSGQLNVNGVTDIASGATLSRNGGSVNPGGALTNLGTLNLAAGDTLLANGSSNAGTLNVRNGVATVGGSFANSGAFNLGTNGGLTIGASGGFDNAAAGVFTFAADSGNIVLAGQRTITNSGTFVSLGGNHSIGNGSSARFDNTPGGVVRVDGGRFILLMNATAPDHGAYSVASGGSLEFPDQNRTFAADSSITGAGTVVFRAFSGGTLNLGGTYTVTGTTQVQGNTTVLVGSTATLGTFEQSGGTFGGTGSLEVTNSFNRTGGTFGTTWESLSITHRTGDLLVASTLRAADNLTLTVTDGRLTVSDALVRADDTLTVNARSIDVVANTGSAAMQGAAVRVNTTGDLSIRGGSSADATASVRSSVNPCTGSVGGNLIVTGGTGARSNAVFEGTPDIGSSAQPFRIGNEVRMSSVSGGGTARVASFADTSIHLDFPTRSSGGYTVNGAAVTSSDGSGFYASGRPAVLGTNLLISYGVAAPEVQTEAPPTDAAVVVAQTIVPTPPTPFPPALGPRTTEQLAEVIDDTKALPGECR